MLAGSRNVTFMPSPKVRISAWVVFFCAFVILFTACSKRTSDEEQVRAVIKKAARAVETKDLKTFMRLLRPDFTDDHGNDYNMVKGVLFGEFMRPGSIKVFITSTDVEVKGGVARANVKLVATRGADLSNIKSISDIIPEESQGFEVSVVLRKEDGKWLAVGANWVEIGVLGLIG